VLPGGSGPSGDRGTQGGEIVTPLEPLTTLPTTGSGRGARVGRWDGPARAELPVGARAGVAVGAPAEEAGGVAEPALLEPVELDLADELGRTGIHSASRPADQRLGPPGDRPPPKLLPPSRGRSRSRSSRRCLAGNAEAWPT